LKRGGVLPTNKSLEEELGFIPDGEELTTPTGLPSINQPTSPNAMQQIGGALNLPNRIGKGLAVGAQKFMETMPVNPLLPSAGIQTPQDVSQLIQGAPQIPEAAGSAVNTGLEAAQPGFQPSPEQENAAALGGFMGDAAMAAVPFGGVGEAALAASKNRFILNALKAGGTGGSLNAIQQASDKGDIDLHDVVFVAGTNAALPLIVPAGKYTARVLRSIAKTGVGAGKVTTLAPEAAEVFVDDPQILEKFAGTKEALDSKILSVQTRLTDYLKKVGNRLGSLRAKFNIGEGIEEWQTKLASGEASPRNPDEIMRDLIDFERGYRFVEKEMPNDRRGMELAGDVIRKTVREEIPIEDRISGLYNGRTELKAYTGTFTTEGEVKKVIDPIRARYNELYGKVNRVLDEIVKDKGAPAGAKMLRVMDSAYSTARDIYDGLQRSLADPGKAEQTMLKIFKGGDPDGILGLNANIVSSIRRFEKATKEKLLDPLRKELAAKSFNEIKPSATSPFIGSLVASLQGSRLASMIELIKGAATRTRATTGLVNQNAPAVIAGTKSLTDE
jgi:hypothetical protein